MRTMVLVYKSLHDWVLLGKGKCWCTYSSTMVRIWHIIWRIHCESKSPNTKPFDFHGKSFLGISGGSLILFSITGISNQKLPSSVLKNQHHASMFLSFAPSRSEFPFSDRKKVLWIDLRLKQISKTSLVSSQDPKIQHRNSLCFSNFSSSGSQNPGTQQKVYPKIVGFYQ